MRYLPKSAADRELMLHDIGVGSIDEFFNAIPREYRLNRDLNVPRQMAESEIIDYFRERSQENAAGYAVFLGAGAYHHYPGIVMSEHGLADFLDRVPHASQWRSSSRTRSAGSFNGR